MGSDKAAVQVGGRPMWTWVVDALEPICSSTLIVGRADRFGDVGAVPDIEPGPLGPLSGLVTALTTTERPVLLVAVDQPLVRVDTLGHLADLGVDGQTAVCIDEIEQVTCAVYQPALAERAREELANGGSIRSLLANASYTRIERARWEAWGEDGRSWFSMDSPADIIEAERRYRLDLLS